MRIAICTLPAVLLATAAIHLSLTTEQTCGYSHMHMHVHAHMHVTL